MIRSKTLVVSVCLALVALIGCSDDPVSDGLQSSNLEVDGGQGDGSALGDSTSDSGASSDTTAAAPDTAVALDTSSQGDDGGADAATSDSNGSGPEQIPCKTGATCNSGVCLDSPKGKFCATPCTEGCPNGYACIDVLSGSDVIHVCAHKTPYRCRTCQTDSDCKLPGSDANASGACVNLKGGGFCLQRCATKGCIGEGDVCAELTAFSTKAVSTSAGKVCLPAKKGCDCLDGVSGHCAISSGDGTCPGTFTCSGGKMGVCQGQTPVAEVCNGKDDDCNGKTDEGVNSVACDLKNVYGTCKGKTLCVGGTLLCQGASAAPEVCNGIDDNCSGTTDEGFTDTDGDKLADCIDPDDDNDTIGDTPDNCPLVANVTQTDNDGDKKGDACDPDDDNDGVLDGKDNCPFTANSSQTDLDKDGKGDACDPDKDGDGVLNTNDNCPLVANATQTDDNSNQIGDACEDDWDGDGVKNKADNCPWIANKAQADLDKDGKGDACDCDLDGDGVANVGAACPKPKVLDNCPLTFNPPKKSGSGQPAKQPDLDGDGRGDACDPDIDGDGDPNAPDCAPEDPKIHHKALEVCNGKDDNCNGATDEPGANGCKTWYVDGDGDGYGVAAFLCLCKPTGKYTAPKSGDCNDKDKAIHPAATEICANGKDDNCNGSVNEEDAKGCLKFWLDADADGYGVLKPRCFCSPSGDYSAKKPGDCADKNAAINPAQNEKCGDGLDNDCDGQLDEAGCQGCQTMYEDKDNDGFGVAGKTKCLGAPKFPYGAFVAGDCNDANANIKPGAVESCNKVDDNCDKLVDPPGSLGCSGFYPDQDGDGWGEKVAPVCLCAASKTHKVNKTGDCNDADKKAAPGLKEVCDGQDNNCNGAVDEGVKKVFYKDNDGDGFGAGAQIEACKAPAAKGYTSVDGDCNDFNKAFNPKAKELCNKADDDCNGLIDDGLKMISIYADVDGDGFGGKNAKAQKHCLIDGKTPPLGYALSHDDCDDSKSTVYPGAAELCDGILNNCNQPAKDMHCPSKCEGKWPVFVGGSSGFPAVAQLDGDNALEVVARNQGAIRALKTDGTIKWKTNLGVSYSYPALADMNNDSTVDIVSPAHGGAVHILNGSDGKILKSYSGVNGSGWYGASVFDVDGDGVTDIIPMGGSTYRLLLLKSNLDVKKIVTLAPLSGEYFSLVPAGIFDLQGDGIAEMVLGSGNWGCVSKPTTCKGRLYVFNADGSRYNDPLWKAKKPHFKVDGYPMSYGGEGRWPLYFDVDGDGVNEVYYTFAKSGTSLWKKDGTLHPQNGKFGAGGFPQVAPVTADWKLDTSGKVRAVGGAVVDIDGGGDYEYIGPGSGGLVVRKGGKVMDGYPIKLGTDPPIVGDINRDGQLDILFTSGSNNSVNCYTLGPDTWHDQRVLHPGATNGIGRSHWPTQGHDPFEPNDVRNKPFDPKTTKNPLRDSRAMRISGLRSVYSSGGGWKHKLQALIGEKGDVDHYVLYGGIIYVTLKPMVKDYDLRVHIFTSGGKYLATRSSTNKGTGTDAVNCHSTNLCPAGAGMFIIEVRGKAKDKDFGPWPYTLDTNWAQ